MREQIEEVINKKKNIKAALENKGRIAAVNSDELKRIVLEELEKLRKLPVEEKNKLVRLACQESYEDVINYAETVNFSDKDGSKSFYWQTRQKKKCI